MNWDHIKGKWNQVAGKAKQRWGELTDDDVLKIDGEREELVGKIQATYGVAREEAERQVHDWGERL